MLVVVSVMANEDVDFSKLFSADDDDGLLCIDIQTIMKVLEEEDNCDSHQEVGFSSSNFDGCELRNPAGNET